VWTPIGLLQPTVLPFGQKYSGTEAQGPYLLAAKKLRQVSNYVDDWLGYANDFDELLRNFTDFLAVCLEYNITLPEAASREGLYLYAPNGIPPRILVPPRTREPSSASPTPACSTWDKLKWRNEFCRVTFGQLCGETLGTLSLTAQNVKMKKLAKTKPMASSELAPTTRPELVLPWTFKPRTSPNRRIRSFGHHRYHHPFRNGYSSPQPTS
jgi:hypothetical protein